MRVLKLVSVLSVVLLLTNARLPVEKAHKLIDDCKQNITSVESLVVGSAAYEDTFSKCMQAGNSALLEEYEKDKADCEQRLAVGKEKNQLYADKIESKLARGTGWVESWPLEAHRMSKDYQRDHNDQCPENSAPLQAHLEGLLDTLKPKTSDWKIGIEDAISEAASLDNDLKFKFWVQEKEDGRSYEEIPKTSHICTCDEYNQYSSQITQEYPFEDNYYRQYRKNEFLEVGCGYRYRGELNTHDDFSSNSHKRLLCENDHAGRSAQVKDVLDKVQAGLKEQADTIVTKIVSQRVTEFKNSILENKEFNSDLNYTALAKSVMQDFAQLKDYSTHFEVSDEAEAKGMKLLDEHLVDLRFDYPPVQKSSVHTDREDL